MSLLQKMFGKRQKRTHPYCAALIAGRREAPTRYGGENKLLQTLDGIPVLVRTLLTIDRVEGIDEIVIAAREDELLPYAELCKTFGLRKPVKVIVGRRNADRVRAARGARGLARDGIFRRAGRCASARHRRAHRRSARRGKSLSRRRARRSGARHHQGRARRHRRAHARSQRALRRADSRKSSPPTF